MASGQQSVGTHPLGAVSKSGGCDVAVSNDAAIIVLHVVWGSASLEAHEYPNVCKHGRD